MKISQHPIWEDINEFDLIQMNSYMPKINKWLCSIFPNTVAKPSVSVYVIEQQINQCSAAIAVCATLFVNL